MECPICYDKIDDGLVTTSCKHKFHSECLLKWYKQSKDCPYCREKLEIDYITQYDNYTTKYYLFKHYKRKTINISIGSDNYDVSFIEKQLLNINSKPKAWLNTKKGVLPLYELFMNDKSILITWYLRAYLIYSSAKKIDLIAKSELNGATYYDTDLDISKEYTKHIITTCIEWSMELFHELKSEYGFIYLTIMNTLLVDLFMNTNINNNVSKSLLQTNIIVCVYNIAQYFHDIKIGIYKLIWYTDNSSNMDDFLKLDKYQQSFIRENLIKI